MNPILVVDIGNTSTSAAIAEAGGLSPVKRCKSIKPAVEFGTFPSRAVIASVNPTVNEVWAHFLQERGVEDILWVSHAVELGVPVSYANPCKIGADRLANACEAFATFGAPVVVCDFGTALTFDVVKRDQGYVGGIICPGLPLMFDYLAERTALLPHIQPVKTTEVIGTNTEEAMRIGARIGYRGMVREILTELEKELGPDVHVCATGGFASWVFDGWDLDIPVDPQLTLKGLARIGTLNSTC